MTNKSKELVELLGIEPKRNCPDTPCGKMNDFDCNNCIRKEVFPDFEKPENFVKLLECLTKIFTNFTITTDSEGNITISWFHFETQLEEEYLNISKNLTEAIILTATKTLDFPYVGDELEKQAQKIDWSY